MSDALGLTDLVQTVGRTLFPDATGSDWLSGKWFEHLQPGSWRGVPFVMDAAENRAGRRVALHEYPYRDTVWPEDLGRLPRRFALQAFLVGDDVYEQRNAMITACEQPGKGTLMHPTLGSIECVLMDFSTTDRRERGRMVEVAFQFVIAGDILFPATQIATGANVTHLADLLDKASAGDLNAALEAVRVVPDVAKRSIGQFTALATAVVNDPGRMMSSVNGLVGLYGRYAAGNRPDLQSSTASLQSALSTAISTRSSALAAADALRGAGLRL